jgi:hypothetical protein
MALASAQKRTMPISRAGLINTAALRAGVATMDAGVTPRLSALVVVQRPEQVQMLSWYQSDTLG